MEVASRASNKPVGIGQGVKGKGSYAPAKAKRRGVVRKPPKSSLEEHLGGVSERKMVDHFTCWYVWLCVLLRPFFIQLFSNLFTQFMYQGTANTWSLSCGSRLVIIHHFEVFLPNTLHLPNQMFLCLPFINVFQDV